MIRSHVNAVKALLTSVTTYDSGKVPDNAVLPYVVLYADGGHATADNLAGDPTHRQWQWQTTAVGADPDQARWAQEKAQSDLLGKTPTVPGRVCGRIVHDLTRDAVADFDVAPPVIYAVDRWRLQTYPT